MQLVGVLFLLCCSSYAFAAEEYVMVEVEPELFEKAIVKRQVQYVQDPRALQYQQQQPVQYQQQPVQYQQQPVQYQQQQVAEQIPPEYINYLQQLQAQQLQAQQAQAQQVQPQADIQQALSNRAPQSFQQQPLPPRQVSPQVEEQRRLQEILAQTKLREQEREDQANQQLISLGLNPTQVRRDRVREQNQRLAAQQAQEQAARQAYNEAEQQQQRIYGQQVIPPQLVQVPQEIPVQQAESSTTAPEQFSYSQVAFGSTRLPQPRLLPGRTQLVYSRPQQLQQEQVQQLQQQEQVQPVPFRQQVQPQQQQVLYRPQVVYRQEKERDAPPQQVLYAQSQKLEPQGLFRSQKEKLQGISFQAPVQYPQSQPQLASQPQAEVRQKQTPSQYLIETTNQKEPQQQVLTIPRRQAFSYRPQPNYEDLQNLISLQQQRAQVAQQRAEVSTTPAPRSSIFVTTSRTPAPRTYSLPEYRGPKQEELRPLTQTELNALINAGFRVTPSRQEQSYEEDYYRGLTKRQNSRPRIGKVPLSEEERDFLAKNGIRSLYKVQGAESQDAPVTYVLAIDNMKRDTEKSTSS